MIVIHPAEFLRAKSSAKLATHALAVGGDSCELLIVGAGTHAQRLEEVLRCNGPTCLLFPRPDGRALSVAQAMALADGARCRGSADDERILCGEARAGERLSNMATSDSTTLRDAATSAWATASQTNGGAREHASAASPDDSPHITVLVPDGSWEQARALVRMLTSRAPEGRLRYVALDAGSVATHESSYIEAMRAGCGRGRLATLEACALFLREAATAVVERGLCNCGTERMSRGCAELGATSARAQGMLEPLIDFVVQETQNDASTLPAALKRAPRHLSEWVRALRAVAADEEPPAGLRRCAICLETLSSPLRMQVHLQGKRHCEAVARRYFASGGPDDAPCAGAALAVFREHSSVPLALTQSDPPDVSLMLIRRALASCGSVSAAELDGERSSPIRAGVAGGDVSKSSQHDVQPVPACLARVRQLPPSLRREVKLRFSTVEHDLRGAVAAMLAQPYTGIGRFGEVRPYALEDFRPDGDVFLKFKARQALYRAVGRCDALLGVYERLIRRVILPYLRAQLSGVDDDQPTVFRYQYPPTLRVQPGPSEQHGPLHRDLEYGHQPGELNFWMPLSFFRETRTTLHVESAPGVGARFILRASLCSP